MHTLALTVIPEGFIAMKAIGEQETPYIAGEEVPENVYIRVKRQPGIVEQPILNYLVDGKPVPQPMSFADLREDCVIPLPQETVKDAEGNDMKIGPSWRLQTNCEILPK